MATSLEAGLDKLALTVQYCNQCTLPLEYCEYTDCTKNDADDPEHKRQTRGGKAKGPKAKKQPEKKLEVFRSNRGKKKFVTVVVGLATFGVDLKDASKLFSKKFACSSSVTGPDEIVVQGDVKYEIIEHIPQKFSDIDPDLIEDGGDQKR